ncbi:MAG: ABC transporter substrate-binding protein [Anaerolineae bacterium]
MHTKQKSSLSGKASLTFIVLLMLLLTGACGGGAAPAEQKPAESKEEPAAAKEEPTAAPQKAATEEAKAEKKSAATEEAKAEEKPAATEAAAAAPASGELQKVRVGLSAFQDVNSIHVGIEKGFYAEEGIELEIQNTDWPGAQELLIGGHVDMATTSDADIALQNAQGQDTTLAFPLFYFAGGGLMYDPNKHQWQTFDAFLEETGGDRPGAMKKTLEQAKGTKVGVSAAGAEYATFVGMVDFAGLDIKDYEIVDLSQEELPPALISGSIDIMIAGIPQRLAVLKEGYATLTDQTALPSTVAHAGFGAHRQWVDENPELAAKIQKVIYKTLAFIEDNPDEGFEIISRHLKEMGTNVAAEDLKGVWNQMEFFVSSKEQFGKEVLAKDGRFYWQGRFQSVVDNLVKTEKIEPLDVPVEDLFYGLKTVEAIK